MKGLFIAITFQIAFALAVPGAYVGHFINAEANANHRRTVEQVAPVA